MEDQDYQKTVGSQSDLIGSIIQDAFPKAKDDSLGNPQSDALKLSERMVYVWIWPIMAINGIRRLINGMDFIQPYSGTEEDSYVVKDTETVYTMTKDAFAGKGKIKFFGIRFMSIWVFPMAITGIVMEFLFVGPMKGVNPFG